jgi:hypothetical protein
MQGDVCCFWIDVFNEDLGTRNDHLLKELHLQVTIIVKVPPAISRRHPRNFHEWRAKMALWIVKNTAVHYTGRARIQSPAGRFWFQGSWPFVKSF